MKTPAHGYRDTDGLYACKETLQCALGMIETGKPCIACAYKIGTFDVALDVSFTQSVANQRPETCPRASNIETSKDLSVLGFHHGMSILTIGDGDFTFSLAVARSLLKRDTAKTTTLVATSYESKEALEQIYPNIQQTIDELLALGTKVVFQVDATALKIGLSGHDLFDRIVWNFPCSAEDDGQDGQNAQMLENKELVREFTSQAFGMLHCNGEICMTHKSKPPFNQWKLEDCVDSQQYKLMGRIVFDKNCLPPYTPRKAKDRKSFPCHDAVTFVFKKVGAEKECRFESTIITCDDEDSDLVPITPEIIDKVRTLHLSFAQHKASLRKPMKRKKNGKVRQATKKKKILN